MKKKFIINEAQAKKIMSLQEQYQPPAPTPVTRYRIDAGGCIECPSSANAQQCPYTEPTCGEGQDPDPSDFSGGPGGGPRPQKNKKRRGKGLPRMQKTRK